MPPAAPVSVTVVAGSAQSDGAYALLDVRAPAGTTLPAHVPTREDATLVVVAGRLEVVVGADKRQVRPGGSVALPRDVPRRVRVLDDARVLVVASPGGVEELTPLLADPVPDLDDVAALLSGFGVTLLPESWSRGSEEAR